MRTQRVTTPGRGMSFLREGGGTLAKDLNEGLVEVEKSFWRYLCIFCIGRVPRCASKGGGDKRLVTDVFR